MTAKTTIDWLRYRTQAGVREGLEALRPMFGAQGADLALKPLERGMDGFQQACAVTFGDMPLGRVDFGGESQRGWARWNITGRGCENVKHWDALGEVEALEKCELRRTDIALTTWHGEVSHDRVVAAHAAGGFTSRGRPPDMRTILSTNPRAGRTCYVGKRESDKFVRAYEKGFELCSKFDGRLGEVTHIDGCAVADIYRVEIELKAVTRVIPWELVERRDEYFAGSYPFLAELLPEVECDILMRRPEREPQMDLKAALANCRVQYGNTLFTALAAYHGDIFKVWDQVLGSEHNQALRDAGVLMVEHD